MTLCVQCNECLRTLKRTNNDYLSVCGYLNSIEGDIKMTVDYNSVSMDSMIGEGDALVSVVLNIVYGEDWYEPDMDSVVVTYKDIMINDTLSLADWDSIEADIYDNFEELVDQFKGNKAEQTL